MKLKKCLIIDSRNHIGGNAYSEKIENINVHKYGAHIFHTNDDDIWNFVNRFSKFNNYVHCLKAVYNQKIYSLPFNMNTFFEIWGTISPKEAEEKINQQKLILNREPKNLEEQALSLVGKDIYEILIKEYTKKQWKKEPIELPSFIIKRLPIRFTYNNNYFNIVVNGSPALIAIQSGNYDQTSVVTAINNELTNLEYILNNNKHILQPLYLI